MRHQGMKLSACGQELGGGIFPLPFLSSPSLLVLHTDVTPTYIIFTYRMGFSGTPSDLLPIELGKCNYELGSDGKMVHVMNNPQVVSCHFVDAAWNPQSVSLLFLLLFYPFFLSFF